MRVAWIEFLERAAAIGDLVAGGGEPDIDAELSFAHAVVTSADRPFPLPYDSARKAFGAFRELARATRDVVRPELRLELAAAMAASARCCRRMLELDDEEAAAAWRRRHQED